MISNITDLAAGPVLCLTLWSNKIELNESGPRNEQQKNVTFTCVVVVAWSALLQAQGEYVGTFVTR